MLPVSSTSRVLASTAMARIAETRTEGSSLGVAVKELERSYCNKETLVFRIWGYHNKETPLFTLSVSLSTYIYIYIYMYQIKLL